MSKYETEVLHGRGAVQRQQVRRQRARRREPRTLDVIPHQVRRPNSTAITCAAFARPTPGAAEIAQRDSGEPVQSAHELDQPIGQIERTAAAQPTAEDERQQLVVAEPRRPEPLELFARAVVWRNIFHLYSILHALPGSHRCGVAAHRAPRRGLWFASQQGNGPGPGCDRRGPRPPGPIDTPRPNTRPRARRSSRQTTPLRLATTAWRSITHSSAASRRKTPRAPRPTPKPNFGDAERALAEVTSLVTDARERGALPPARSVAPRQALPGLTEQVQKASKAIQAEDYEALGTLTAVKQGVQQLLPQPGPSPGVQSPRHVTSRPGCTRLRLGLQLLLLGPSVGPWSVPSPLSSVLFLTSQTEELRTWDPGPP